MKRGGREELEMKRTFFLVVMAIAILSLLLSCGSSEISGGGQQNATSPTTAPTPMLVPQSQNLVNATITVDAGSYYGVRFSVDTVRMQNAAVVGTFTASGGSGNDIDVFILDDIAFTNWVNGHQVMTLYYPGRLTTERINVSVTSSGTYHLVFSNKFSIISAKNVSTKVDLNWSELRYQ
jgi:hypothetical protein